MASRKPAEAPKRPVKNNFSLALLGAPGTGKTALLQSHLFNVYPSIYTPSFDSIYMTPKLEPPYTQITYFDNGNTSLQLQLRAPISDVVVLCFSVVSPQSLNDAIKLAGSLISEGVKFLLVGCKSDARPANIPLLREDEDPTVVFQKHGLAAAHRLGAVYVECSTLKEVGVDEVFDVAWKLGTGELKMGRPEVAPEMEKVRKWGGWWRRKKK